jgi:hypothetical protein
MSNLFFNIRVLYWHFQLMSDRPYVRFSFNPHHWEQGIGWSWVRVYPIAIGRWS